MSKCALLIDTIATAAVAALTIGFAETFEWGYRDWTSRRRACRRSSEAGVGHRRGRRDRCERGVSRPRLRCWHVQSRSPEPRPAPNPFTRNQPAATLRSDSIALISGLPSLDKLTYLAVRLRYRYLEAFRHHVFPFVTAITSRSGCGFDPLFVATARIGSRRPVLIRRFPLRTRSILPHAEGHFETTPSLWPFDGPPRQFVPYERPKTISAPYRRVGGIVPARLAFPAQTRVLRWKLSHRERLISSPRRPRRETLPRLLFSYSELSNRLTYILPEGLCSTSNSFCFETY